MKVFIKNISKSYGNKKVLERLCLSAQSGECIGILGENGSGKSTLFSLLYGLQKGKGSFLLDTTDLMRNTEARKATVGFVPQDPPLINELTALDNLRLWYSAPDLKRELKCGVLKMLGVDEFKNVTVSKLSGGMKKRLCIGCSVAHKPKILLLDEPTAALDIVCKESISNYLKEFTKQGGIAIIATHDVYDLAICDSLYILKGGKLHLYEGERSSAELIKSLK